MLSIKAVAGDSGPMAKNGAITHALTDSCKRGKAPLVCDLCEYKAISASALKRHKSFKHNIGVTWHTCDLCASDCASPYKTKSAGNLKVHKANVHDVGTVIYSCDLCEFTAKSSGNLKKHKAYVHDIDVTWHKCSFCNYKAKKAANLREHIRKCRSNPTRL